MATKKIKTAQGRKEHPKKKLAKMMCIEQGYDLKEISLMLDINVNTLSKWNKDENWKIQQTVRKAAPDKMILSHYEDMQLTFDRAKQESRPLTPAERDSILKLSQSIKNLDKSASTSIVMSVLKNFNNYLVLIDVALAKQFVDHQLNYVQSLIEQEK